MSRSYKHTPSCNVVKPDGSFKRFFNRRLRRSHMLDLPQGNAYRKLNETWKIHDWRQVGVSFGDYCRSRHAFGFHEPPDVQRDDYERYYLRK